MHSDRVQNTSFFWGGLSMSGAGRQNVVRFRWWEIPVLLDLNVTIRTGNRMFCAGSELFP